MYLYTVTERLRCCDVGIFKKNSKNGWIINNGSCYLMGGLTPLQTMPKRWKYQQQSFVGIVGQLQLIPRLRRCVNFETRKSYPCGENKFHLSGFSFILLSLNHSTSGFEISKVLRLH